MMDGNGVHAYKFVNEQGETHYVKFRWKSLQGLKNLDPKENEAMQGKDYSHLSRDLITAIDNGDYPKWDLMIQVLAGGLGEFDFDPLDATKIWPDVPERKIGQMVLNKNPDNIFQETEQVAMAPANTCRASSRPRTACCRAVCSPTPIPRCTASVPTA